jgi:hypothetical protein
MLVLTGVTHPAEVVSAPPKWRPTLIAADLGGLLVPHTRVHGGDGVATCGEWRAAYVDGRLDVTGAGDPYDGLRALCGASWSAADAVGADAAREAVRKVGL